MVFDDFDQVNQLAGNLQGQLQQVQQQLMQGGMPGIGGIGGGLGGILSYLPWIGLAWFAYYAMRRGAGPSMAVSKIEINPTARVTTGAVIRFEGRRRGLIAKLLSFFGRDPQVNWVASKDAVQSEYSDLFGRNTTIIPIRQISVIHTRFTIARTMFYLGLFLAIVGLFNFRSFFGIVQLLVGIGIAVYAFFKKQYVVSVASSASGSVSIAIQPGLIGPSFDLDKLNEVATLLQKLIRGSDREREPREDRERIEREPAIPLASIRAMEQPIVVQPRIAEPPVARMTEPESSHSSSIPLVAPVPRPPIVGSVFQPEGAPRPRPARPRPKKSVRIPREPEGPPASKDEEKLATEAFEAAVRVFESKRPSEAEAAWWALIRRWPNTNAAKRARRVLDNRRKRERERNEKRGQTH